MGGYAQAVVEHLPELLACHEDVRVQQLRSAQESQLGIRESAQESQLGIRESAGDKRVIGG